MAVLRHLEVRTYGPRYGGIFFAADEFSYLRRTGLVGYECPRFMAWFGNMIEPPDRKTTSAHVYAFEGRSNMSSVASSTQIIEAFGGPDVVSTSLQEFWSDCGLSTKCTIGQSGTGAANVRFIHDTAGVLRAVHTSRHYNNTWGLHALPLDDPRGWHAGVLFTTGMPRSCGI
jgi:hypothetical protein